MTEMMFGSAPLNAYAFFEKYREHMAGDLARTFDASGVRAFKEQSPEGKEVPATGAWVQLARDQFKRDSVQILDRTFHVSTRAAILSSQTEERPTGSDLAIYFEVRGIPPHPFQLIKSKTLLVQAKCGEENGVLLEFGDDRLLGQMNAIKALTGGDGYLLVLTSTGAKCVTVAEAFKSIKGNRVRTANWRPSSDIFRNIANCTAGNCSEISPESLRATRLPSDEIDLDDANRKLAELAKTKQLGTPFSPSHALSLSLELRS